ncbi:MAG: hypothetical protein CFE29_25250 [Bradyrhizobiaceae bacterium PARB1]|jgi:hypothetical protein|nr:MAG: hypothetical protein CFE29_25250 [Bradyrhizobiaceae bacterium PARB1]
MDRSPYSPKDSKDIIASLIRDTRRTAMKMPPGVERDRLLRKAGHDDVAANLHAWANSSGLQGPI